MGSNSDKKEKKDNTNVDNFSAQNNFENYQNGQMDVPQQMIYTPSNNDNNSSENLNEGNFNERDYILKYNDNELMNMLQKYIENFKIIDSIYGKKEEYQDPVFEDINENQKNILIDYFNKNKNEISKALLTFLTSRSINVAQNIIADLFQTEDFYSAYEKKVLREIAKINENKDLFKIKYLTILLVGKTGVGKSTLINCVLNLEGPERAKENETDSETLQIRAYKSKKIPYLRLVDTRGLELGKYDANALAYDCSIFFNEQKNTKDMNKFIHCIWYCVTGARLENVEKQAIESLKKSYKISNIPIIIVYTQSNNKKLIDARKKNVQENNIANDYISILAREVEQPDGTFLKSFGLPELLTKTLNVCKKALNGDMHLLMTNNIVEYINNKLLKENSKINKYIKEKNILNFIQNYNSVRNKDEFQNYIIKVYGNNIHYFLNKELSTNGVNIIKGSYLISIHNNNYINYYLDIINQVVSKELYNLSINGLIIQASIEKKKGMSTLIQNKRDLEDFSKQNSKFLSDNFIILAQKYYIYFILQKSCIEFSNLCEQQFNNLIIQILRHPNIGNKINHLFQQRFKEFEVKIVNKNHEFKMPGNYGISYNNNNFLDNNNGRDDYTGNNGQIVVDFNNNNLKSIQTEDFSNPNFNKNIIYNANNQPNFYPDLSSKISHKGFDDISSTKTIPIDLKFQNQNNNKHRNLKYSNSQKNLIQNNNINFQNQFSNYPRNPNINYYNGAYNLGYNSPKSSSKNISNFYPF